jgi:hypothetical protein
LILLRIECPGLGLADAGRKADPGLHTIPEIEGNNNMMEAGLAGMQGSRARLINPSSSPPWFIQKFMHKVRNTIEPAPCTGRPFASIRIL